MLSKEQVESFSSNGFLVVPDVLTADQVAEARRIVDGLIEQSRSVTENNDLFVLEPGHTADTPMIARVKGLSTRYPFFDEIGKSDAFVDRVWQLVTGTGLMYLGGGRLNMKPPGGSSAEWHQDGGYWPITNNDRFTVGLYLDDATVDNGCMWMIPGSHKNSILSHHEDGVFVGAISANDPEADFESAVAIEVPAGGISIHTPFTVHGSGPNRSNKQRRLVLYGYQGSDHWRLFDGTSEHNIEEVMEKRRSQLIRGELATTMRFEERLQRIQYPRPDDKASLFMVQRAQKNAYFKDRRLPGGDRVKSGAKTS